MAPRTRRLVRSTRAAWVRSAAIRPFADFSRVVAVSSTLVYAPAASPPLMLDIALARAAWLSARSQSITRSSQVKKLSQAGRSCAQAVRSAGVMSAVCAESRTWYSTFLSASSPLRLYPSGPSAYPAPNAPASATTSPCQPVTSEA